MSLLSRGNPRINSTSMAGSGLVLTDLEKGSFQPDYEPLKKLKESVDQTMKISGTQQYRFMANLAIRGASDSDAGEILKFCGDGYGATCTIQLYNSNIGSPTYGTAIKVQAKLKNKQIYTDDNDFDIELIGTERLTAIPYLA